MNRTLLPLFLLPLVAACSYFSQTPDSALVERVHREIPVGMSTDDAEIKLGAMDFACSATLKHGAFTDEHGVEHENQRYMQCLRKPARIGFACENRDQVLIVPTKSGKVDAITVIRAPDCRS